MTPDGPPTQASRSSAPPPLPPARPSPARLLRLFVVCLPAYSPPSRPLPARPAARPLTGARCCTAAGHCRIPGRLCHRRLRERRARRGGAGPRDRGAGSSPRALPSGVAGVPRARAASERRVGDPQRHAARAVDARRARVRRASAGASIAVLLRGGGMRASAEVHLRLRRLRPQRGAPHGGPLRRRRAHPHHAPPSRGAAGARDRRGARHQAAGPGRGGSGFGKLQAAAGAIAAAGGPRGSSPGARDGERHTHTTLLNNVPDSDAMYADSGRCFPRVRPKSVNNADVWPILDQTWPNYVVGPTSAELGRNWPEFGA